MPKGLVSIGAQMNVTMHNIAKYARCATAFSVSSCVLVLNALRFGAKRSAIWC